MKDIEVVAEPGKAKVLVDPMRREIVRLLADRPTTEKELAEALGLSDPSVGHHLKILRESGLVRLARKEAEEHGIIQKFYEANALFYVINDRNMPLEIKRYFMPVGLERTRGMIAALKAIVGEPRIVNTKELEELAKTIDSTIVEIAQRRTRQWKENREELIVGLYQDALTHILERTDILPQGLRDILHKTRSEYKK
jgi:DNA-binding transcriptional ArsR family regulator